LDGNGTSPIGTSIEWVGDGRGTFPARSRSAKWDGNATITIPDPYQPAFEPQTKDLQL
jgi:hypothetical protein